ncbi:MAG: tetratricopeptide repeat protein, partial [Rhodospirillales bacterium]|nr:tetratricopeptide repeat protein [Rhodospirillales bacterium]
MPEQVANRSSGQQTLSIQDALDLAVVHHTAGDLAKAESVYRKILETDPDHPAALQLLGVSAHQMGRNDAAVDLISRAIARDPDYAEAHNNLGLALHDLGKLDQAVASYHQALAIKSDYAEANNNLGLALQALGKVEDALASYLQALATEPDYAGAHYNFGNALRELGRLDEAIASYQKALAIRPGFAEAHYHLGETLRELGRLEEAVASYREALSIKPDFAEVLNNLGNALRELGRLDDALASYRKALDFKPDFSGAGRNLLYALLNVSGLSQEELFNEHLRFSETHLRGIARPVEDLTNDPTSHRRLRVGYLSSDFHNHPVGSNVLPLLSSHDRKKFEIFCYAQVRRPDAMTQRFRSCVDHWRAIAGKSDSEVAGMVRADGIDILVCLAGHAGDNRLLVCAYRAAPVQVSFHDLASSALAEMDYWLTDAFLHPPGTKERFTEELQPLQVFYQYPPVLEAPPVDRLPADQAGFVTFGSFNNPAKVNEDVTGLWAKVLKSVPGSRLLFKYLNWYAQESL